ncbi:MAG: pantoate--beta-alanine ligase [Planctomycetota bacterium]|jgi:pantoate--beta-alanine ligase
MQVLKTIEEVRTFNLNEGKLGFVPTMGALHQGHASLIAQSVKDCDRTVVSIFVNPAQFAPNEDLDSYPRTLDADLKLCTELAAEAVFVPTTEQIYPDKQVTWVDVEGMTDVLCGAARPGHFRGVTTVVSKLFNIVQPAQAYFGQKDAQQVLVIKRMVHDLNMPTKIITCPTVREPDGLAMSSRNAYMGTDDRSRAVCISRALKTVESAFGDGQTQVSELSRILQEGLQAGVDTVDYAEFRDAHSLEEVNKISQQTLVAVAAFVGKTRLIDNILIG